MLYVDVLLALLHHEARITLQGFFFLAFLLGLDANSCLAFLAHIKFFFNTI